MTYIKSTGGIYYGLRQCGGETIYCNGDCIRCFRSIILYTNKNETSNHNCNITIYKRPNRY